MLEVLQGSAAGIETGDALTVGLTDQAFCRQHRGSEPSTTPITRGPLLARDYEELRKLLRQWAVS